jgi:hypothetical protein
MESGIVACCLGLRLRSIVDECYLGTLSSVIPVVNHICYTQGKVNISTHKSLPHYFLTFEVSAIGYCTLMAMGIVYSYKSWPFLFAIATSVVQINGHH